MTVGPRASTERKEDQREVRGKMTLTVEYSEMTAKIVEHFKIERFSKPNIRFGSGSSDSKIVSKFRLTHNRKLRSANRNAIDHIRLHAQGCCSGVLL